MSTWTSSNPSSPASPGSSAGAAARPAAPSVLVWDAPVRVVHALLAVSFLGAFITAESERWRLLHITLGYTALGLVVFRLLWGVLGTRHARFASFVRGPRAVWAYLASLAGPKPQHHIGHNPAGAWAIVGLLGGVMLTAATGWATDAGVGGHLLEELHEGVASAVLALVGVHVVGVIVSSFLHRENLARAMVTGRKQGQPGDGIGRAWLSVAALVLTAVMAFWAWQWAQAPSGGAQGGDPAVTGAPGGGTGGGAAERRDRREGHGERGRRDHDDD